MTKLKMILFTSLPLMLAISTRAYTQESPPFHAFKKGISLEQAQTQCEGKSLIKVDDIYQCHAFAKAETTQKSIVKNTITKMVQHDNLDKIIDDMQKHDLLHNPIEAGSEGDREALRHLPDASLSADLANIQFSQNLLSRYKAINQASLRGENKLNYQLLGYVLQERIAFADFDTSRLPFTNDSGFFNMMSYVFMQTRFETIDDYEAYAARLSELPRFFAQHQANLKRGVNTGYTASKEILPGIIDTIAIYAKPDVNAHSFYTPFKTFPKIINASEQERLTKLGQKTMAESVIPAYQKLHTFFVNDYAPHARTDAGIGTNPQSRKYYKALVKHFTTLNLTPDQVHETGLTEVKRIRAEMDEIIKKTGFEGDFKDFLTFLRTDEQFYAKTPKALLKEAAWIAKRVDGLMPKYFGTLPRLSYGVMPVPDDIAPKYTTGRYWGGNMSNGVAGNYVVNTYDLSQRPLYNLPSLTLHEGVPGHHHQISLAQEMKGVPSFRQSLYPNAFGEGWGLYAEKLGVEMGIYQTDYENFGRLTYEMWRACRLVVDTGMHWKGWTRAQAEQCFFENSALAPHNIRTEVERYISWPGQALAYKIGELKIWELRGRAEKALGADFDIRQFHDAVLRNGGIPLNILEERIDEWIADSLSHH
ncbi:MAG: DUF885 domain-containing protein [Robiginitomaculum sp.]|nr:MAG: DUF885 domain-containing protein [Robiginitomaculum sp.]